MKNRGFTLIELLVVVVIAGILSVIGLTYYGGIRGLGDDARKKSEIDAIAKAYETTFNDRSGYKVLSGIDFTSGGLPAPPEGGSYTFVSGPNSSSANGNNFKVCATLKGGAPGCSESSSICYCRTSYQGSAP